MAAARAKRTGWSGRTTLVWALAAALVPLVAACNGQDNTDRIKASGTLEATTAQISADTPGRVTRVAAEVGDAVQRGAVLVTLDPTQLDAQLSEAQAGLDAAQAELDRVRTGARAEALRVAEAALEHAVAQRAVAAAALDLAQAVGSTAGASGLSVNDAETADRQAAAGVSAARAALDAARQGASDAELAQAVAGVRQAEAAVAAVKARRARVTLRAPIAGRVLSRSVERGMIAPAGAALMRVADLDNLTVTVYVPENELHRVAIGDRVEVTVDAYPDETFDGKVTSISSRAEFTPRNTQTEAQRSELVVAVKAEVPNADGSLKPGMPADVVIRTDSSGS
jgi:HlyD family secretion protein